MALTRRTRDPILAAVRVSLCVKASFALLVVALTALLPPGWSLCVGSRGHFAVEPVSSPVLHSCDPHESASESDWCGSSEGCGDCLDLILPAGLAVRSDIHALPDIPIAPAALAGQPGWHAHEFERPVLGPDRALRPHAAHPLETIVIRC
jgi:hypothetical protein